MGSDEKKLTPFELIEPKEYLYLITDEHDIKINKEREYLEFVVSPFAIGLFSTQMRRLGYKYVEQVLHNPVLNKSLILYERIKDE